MIFDSSAIVAILTEEPGCKQLLSKLEGTQPLGVGAPTILETGIVLSQRLRSDAFPVIVRFLDEIGADVLPFDRSHWSVAIEAFLRFGKGRHPAALNFGDCLAYAVAKVAGQSLLFVGNDFGQTDIDVA